MKHQAGRYYFTIRPAQGLSDYGDVELTTTGFRTVFRMYRPTPENVTEFIERNLL
jgi:hypothetical protein